jgi:uncharacterized protein YneF (UPF0154 family)
LIMLLKYRAVFTNSLLDFRRTLRENPRITADCVKSIFSQGFQGGGRERKIEENEVYSKNWCM